MICQSLTRIIHEARELGRARLQPCRPEPQKCGPLRSSASAQLQIKQDDSGAVPQRLKPELGRGHTARLKAVPFPMPSKPVMDNPT